MDHRVAAFERGTQRLRLAQVADVRLAPNAFQVHQVACLPHQQPQLGAARYQRSRNVVADKSRCACHKNFHEVFSSSILNRGLLLWAGTSCTKPTQPIEAIWANASSSPQTSAGRSRFLRK